MPKGFMLKNIIILTAVIATIFTYIYYVNQTPEVSNLENRLVKSNVTITNNNNIVVEREENQTYSNTKNQSRPASY